jgi:adenosylmethionine-8-amino-7-oxononanoate aminotransferase
MSPSVACSPFQEVGVATAKDAIKVLAEQSYLLDRDIQNAMPKAETAVGNYFYLEGGRKVFDSTCGAAVSCLGHCDRRVIEAIHAQMCRLDYCPSVFFGTDITEDAAKILIEGTGHKMSKVFICNSGPCSIIPDLSGPLANPLCN